MDTQSEVDTNANTKVAHFFFRIPKQHNMKPIVLTLCTMILCVTTSAQFVAKMEIKEPIPGLCNEKEVYAMLPIKGQEEAQCPVTKDQILERLNIEVQYLKDHPKYDDKGMIGLIISCKGLVVKCEMDNKTKTPELDKQIEDVFNSLGNWTSGKLNGKEVDTARLFSFKIKDGKITFS